MTEDSEYQVDEPKIEGLCEFGNRQCKRRAVTKGIYLTDGKFYLICRHHYESLKESILWQIEPPPDKSIEGTLNEQDIDKKLASLEETDERKCIVCTHWYDIDACLPCYKLDTHPNFHRVEGMSLIRKRFRDEHGIGDKAVK